MRTMKNNKITMGLGLILMALSFGAPAIAQKLDDERMKRDIEVAENVLATLIKQELNQQRTFFGLDVKGSYQPGYGVTFRIPMDYQMPFVISIGEEDMVNGRAVIARDGYTFSYSHSEGLPEEGREAEEKNAFKLKEKVKEKRKLSQDSIREAYNEKVIKASKDFILDFGDFISQLGPNEKIVVTNQGEQHFYYFNTAKRSRISIEGAKADINAFKTGKLTREQALAKLTVLNTVSVDVKEPEMELLSSIFNRLYQPDLSRTYFSGGNIYYERLRDHGVIFYMQVYSSNERENERYSMPTLKLENVDRETRDKKVVELYPLFQKDIQENILEYGRTLKSLKDDEVLIFNVALTKCKGCGIPSSLEISVKNSVLKDFSTGKMDKNTALERFTIKKGADQ